MDSHEIRLAAEDLFADYAWAIDQHEPELLREVFAEDATFAMEIPSTGVKVGPIEGRDAVVEFIAGSLAEQTDSRRHTITNFRTTVATEEAEQVRAYLNLSIVDGDEFALRATGVFHVDLAATGHGRRIAALSLSLDRQF
jgi:hypothetical protein